MILLFHGTGPIGAAIRWQTWSDYSHAAWMLPDGSVIESWQSGGVQHNRHPFVLHGADATFDVFTVRGLTSHQAALIEKFLRTQLGAGYDFLGIARFLSRVNRNNFDRWFCSELVAEGCEFAGRPLLRTDAYRIAPGHLRWSTEVQLHRALAGLGWWEMNFGRAA